MRPSLFYACYADGQVFAVLRGTAAAIRACGGRRHYFGPFGSELAAQEYAAWWNYLAYQPGGHLAHLSTRISSPSMARTF